jgi:SAM-dependent methyltransferase
MDSITATRALDAYAPLAPHYDTFTGGHAHDAVLAGLERLALAAGLSGNRVLDVACGTGKSFLPLMRRGYEVTGCDLSPEMLAVARRNAPPDVALFRADMRRLPAVRAYDLVTCLDDAVNYLLTEDDLEVALASMAGVLRPGGVLVFDLNTLAGHRDAFTTAFTVEEPDLFLCFHGLGLEAERPGEPGTAAVEIFQREPEGHWRREQSVHHQRHWSLEETLAALDRVGLTDVAAYGQHDGANFELVPDELEHNKIVYVARRGDREEDPMRRF